MSNVSLYIDLSKAIKFDVPLASKVHALAPGRTSADYDYAGRGPKPNDSRSWEPTSGGGWRTADPAGQPSKAGQEKGPEKAPSLEERQITKDPTKELAAAPGVESKQSILSGKKEDFKDHSPEDHYRILAQVSHDPKLADMHNTHIKEKTEGFTAQEHQVLSDSLAQAHAENPSQHLSDAAQKHGKAAQDITSMAEKTKESISAETGQKEMGRQIAGAKLDDKEEKLTIDGEGYGVDVHATYEEASAAHKKDLESAKAEFTETTEGLKESTKKIKFEEKPPKAADFAEGKVPPEAKKAYEDRKAHANSLNQLSKDLADDTKERAKKQYDDRKAELKTQKPKAADWKAKEKEAAQAEEDIPKPPTTDLERAEVTGHTSKAKELMDNINSHIDSGELSDEDLNHLSSIRDAMAEHQSLTTIPSKNHKTDLKLAQGLAGEHGKKPYEEAAAPKAAAQPRRAAGGQGVMSAFQSGRVAGEQIGEAAGSQEGGGAIGSAAITYAAQGAVSAGGHFLLDKDVKFTVPKKSPLLTQKQLRGREARS